MVYIYIYLQPSIQSVQSEEWSARRGVAGASISYVGAVVAAGTVAAEGSGRTGGGSGSLLGRVTVASLSRRAGTGSTQASVGFVVFCWRLEMGGGGLKVVR